MNVTFAQKLPTTSCNIPMAGTKEFQDWKAEKQTQKAEQQDTFNGKPAEEKQPTILNKIVQAFKNFESTFLI